MSWFNRKKEVSVNFFRAKAGVFLERLNNGVVSQGTYNHVIARIILLERILLKYPFYRSYTEGSLRKKEFLADLKSFYAQLMGDGMSQKEFYEIIQQVELNEVVSFESIVKEDVNIGDIKGTIFKIGTEHRNGIVLTHGISCSRYNLLNLASVLSRLGYLVLAIDLPKHNLNQGMDLTMGNIAELIRDSVTYLRRGRGLRNVAVIGHSLGSVGTLLASAGYTAKTEREIYFLWEGIRKSIEKGERYSKLRPGTDEISLQAMLRDDNFMDCLGEIAAYFKKIKEIILDSLKSRDKLGYDFVDCCVLLAMPSECKKAFVGASFLERLPNKWIKAIWETIMHNFQIKLIMEEGNIFNYVEEKTHALRWWYLKVENPSEFIRYFSSVKEPADFISLMNILSRFSKRDNKFSFIDYYLKKYVKYPPKLFIYGKWDVLLRPFMPGSRKRLEDNYRAYGNASIIMGNYSHILVSKPFQQMASVAVTSDVVLQNIINFLNKNMNPNRIPGYH
ncbi:alpha/beta hydrolase [Candidatus Woesearchaeota archaeon]|nr:alpha/beta hydrolase [Candidatus Woesearchaeota archaeon]